MRAGRSSKSGMHIKLLVTGLQGQGDALAAHDPSIAHSPEEFAEASGVVGARGWRVTACAPPWKQTRSGDLASLLATS
jgi:hypothetical protein